MCLSEKIIDQRFDGLVNGLGLTLDLGAFTNHARDLDPVGWQRNGCVPCPGADVFDLAAVAIAVKRNDDGFNSSGGERIKQDGLVGSSNLLGTARVIALLLVECSVVNGGLGCRLWIVHDGSPEMERARRGGRARQGEGGKVVGAASQAARPSTTSAPISSSVTSSRRTLE